MMRRLGRMSGRGAGPPSFRRIASVPTLVSALLAAGVLALLVTRFDVDLRAAWRLAASGSLGLYLLAFGVNVWGLYLRGLRWRLIASSAGIGRQAGGRLPGQVETAVIVQSGWFLNAVGWLRMGDAYRAFAFGRTARTPFSLSLGVVAAERVMDVLAVLPLFVLAVAGLAASQGGRSSLVFIAIAAAMACFGVGVLFVMAVAGKRLAQRLPRPLQESYLRFHEGALGSFRRLPAAGVLSIAIWLSEAFRLYLVVQALDVPVGPALVLFVSLVNAVLTTVPFTPGGIGFVEPGIVGALSLALSRDQAVAVALVDRSISYGSVVILGASALALYELVWMRRQGRGAAAAKIPNK
ncbi:MAG: flippase-like domain-containing protein [SAR202 cluster bacterium]|nr:flippase-like domain-containing protein [SAR202 cluster bacterium]